MNAAANNRDKISSETSEQENMVLVVKYPDNLRIGRRLSGISGFFSIFSKLSAPVWLVYPAFSYKYFGFNEEEAVKKIWINGTIFHFEVAFEPFRPQALACKFTRRLIILVD